MENILEEQRRLHEERERLIDLQTKEMLRKKTGVRKLGLYLSYNHFYYFFHF